MGPFQRVEKHSSIGILANVELQCRSGMLDVRNHGHLWSGSVWSEHRGGLPGQYLAGGQGRGLDRPGHGPLPIHQHSPNAGQCLRLLAQILNSQSRHWCFNAEDLDIPPIHQHSSRAGRSLTIEAVVFPQASQGSMFATQVCGWNASPAICTGTDASVHLLTLISASAFIPCWPVHSVCLVWMSIL